MEPKKRRIILAILFIISIGNYSRISSSGNIRTVEFLSIFVIGALSALLIHEAVTAYRNK